MPKRAKELSPVEVKRLTTPGAHPVGGVAGLLLQVQNSGARSWVLRATVGGKRRDIGLGAYPEVGLGRAREKASDIRNKIREGIDPVAERKTAQDALRAAQAARITFDECAHQCLASKSQEFRNPKHIQQWQNTLTTYASPVIGKLPVSDVRIEHIVRILESLWTTKTETAVRLRGRLEAVLAWATVRGYRSGDNPARWKGHLDAVLPQPTKVTKVQHFKAMPVDEIGEFMRKLRARHGVGARALEFLILSAARSGEVRGARWSEMDFKGKTWTIPGERMKAGREHVVPLSDDALRLLKDMPRHEGTELIFPNSQGRRLSDATLTAVLRRMERNETVHGFRSTFSDWCAERTGYPSEVREMALAHTITDKTEAAYRRGPLLEKRHRLMADWARFCAEPKQQAAAATNIREANSG